MNLAARLDRLRGRAPTAELRGHTARATADAARQPTTAYDTPSTQALADALQAQLCDDVLIRDEHCSLSRAGRPEVDLASLPDTFIGNHRDWVYLDVESTGLSGGVGNLAFLVGLARRTGVGRLQVRQYLLGSFAAERVMLETMNAWIGPNATLVSYNGKSFDVPLLDARLRLHGLRTGLSQRAHLDLLYPVRRAFRRHWPDCRLQTAEQRLLGWQRVADLPGALAPAAWQGWLRHAETARLHGVLQHNRQDVVSLALLHTCLVPIYAGDGPRACDHAAVGRAWRLVGDDSRAQLVWERAGDALSDAGCLQLAANYRRQGDWARAEALWLQLFARGNVEAACELSKFYEHRLHDPERAFRFAAHCQPTDRQHRLMRLQRKLANAAQLRLWDSDSAGEGDEVGRAIGRR